jgi:hypothetical protein
VLPKRTNLAVTRARLRHIQGKCSCRLYKYIHLPAARRIGGSAKGLLFAYRCDDTHPGRCLPITESILVC